MSVISSNYNKVVNFNTCFGNIVNKVPQISIMFDTDNQMLNRYALIKEEIKELNQAIDDNNMVEVVDALMDILYVTYGMMSYIGINGNIIFDMLDNSNSTNYEKVSKLTISGKVFDELSTQLNINPYFSNSVDVINYTNEFLISSIRDNNFTLMVSYLVSLIYYTYEASFFLGVCADDTFDLVHNNNMSKLCSSEDEAKLTVEYYLKNDHLGYESPYYEIAPDPLYYVVKNKSTKKILKSINWKNVDLSSYLTGKS